MSIKKDLALGKKAEQYLINILEENEISCDNVEYVDRSLYDIHFTWDNHNDLNRIKKEYTIEVKYDVYSSKSGNIAIEIYNPIKGKPSGVGITKADFWCHIVGTLDNMYLTTVPLLKKYIDKHPPLRVIHRAGDGNATICLYKQEKILSIFKKINTNNIKSVIEEYNNDNC